MVNKEESERLEALLHIKPYRIGRLFHIQIHLLDSYSLQEMVGL